MSIEKTCKKCGEKFVVFPYRITSAKFCSQKCKTLFGFSKKTLKKMSSSRLGVTPWNKDKKFPKMNGNKHAFKGEKRTRSAYHWEARKFLENIKKCFICKEIKKGFQMVVHHKNENPKDNRLSNLQRLCRKCHINVHRKLLLTKRKK